MSTDYAIRRSRRARRVAVRVDRVSGEIQVTLPERAPQREAQRAVVRHQRWIAARQAEAAVVRAQRDARGNVVSVWGEPLRCEVDPGRQRTSKTSGSGGGRLLLPAEGTAPALERFVRARARAELTPLTTQAAAAVGREVKQIKIGDARTRWGSCSARGTISYSWRLALAPPWVAEAIVWHEVCHLVELNHSERFWRLLRAHEPKTDDARQWLRRNGAGLLLPNFGPALQAEVQPDRLV